MSNFIRVTNIRAKTRTKPRSKQEAKARAVAVYDDLQLLAQTEVAPAPLTEDDIKRKLRPSSFKQYKSTMQFWRDFITRQLKEVPTEPLFSEPPTIHRIKVYLRWLARSRTGLLEDNITDTTLRNRLATLKRAIKLHTHYKYSAADNEAIDTFIVQELVGAGELSTAARPKPVAPLPVAEDLALFSWVCDEYQGMHPRMRVQLSFAIILMSVFGNRPGEFIESDAWKTTNEGLLYDDVRLFHQDDHIYKGFFLKVRFRNRKGHRDNDKHAPQIPLLEETRIRSMCPVLHFMALALADGVFSEVSSFEELRAFPIPPSKGFHLFKHKPQTKTQPIIRSTCPDGSISQDRILSYDAFNNALKGLGQRAGYEENMSGYCFRRAYARTILKSVSAKASQVLMDHLGKDTIGYYTSGTIDIDSQSIVRGRPQRVEFMEMHTSMMANRDLSAPQPPGSQLVKSTIIRAAPLQKDHPEIELSTRNEGEQYELRRQSRNRAYKKEREDFFESDQTPTTEIVSIPQRSPSRYLKALWKFDEDREALVKLMFLNSKVDVGTDVALEAVIEHMINIARPGRRKYSYKCAEPLAGDTCSVCMKRLDIKRPARYNAHLLYCARQRLIGQERTHMTTQFDTVRTCQWHDCNFQFGGKTCIHNSIHVTDHLKRMKSHQCLWNGCLAVFESFEKLAYHISEKHRVPNDWTMLTKMHYCYEHDLWCRSEQQWVQHIKHDHFPHMNEFCGLIRQAGVVIVAAHCLFCLGDVSLPLAVRFAQFPEPFTLHKHMKQHLTQANFPLASCPHPRCRDPLASECAFWEHANLVHGSPALEPWFASKKRKCLNEEDTGQDSSASNVHGEGSAAQRLCIRQDCGEASSSEPESRDCTPQEVTRPC